MKFSTKSRYALRLMAELARYAPGTTVSLKEISERQNLSLKYLEQIVTPPVRSCGPLRAAWPPSPAWAARPTSAPCRSSASPCPFGPGWMR